MENPEKKVVSFFLDGHTMSKLDAICASQRRNRSLQVAFLIDEIYSQLFPHNGGLMDVLAPEDEKGAQS